MNDVKKFYISDLHFGHTNCLAFDNRPFSTIAEHDAELIRRWNSVVRPGDIVYILGDMFWCKQQKPSKFSNNSMVRKSSSRVTTTVATISTLRSAL